MIRIFCKSSECMKEVKNNSIHLIVTSPPYNVEKEYEKGTDFDSWKRMLMRVFLEAWRVLVPGGRIAVNVANIGRNPFLPVHHIISSMLSNIGFMMRGEIIWDKGPSMGFSTAWGSWCSPNNPSLRDYHENVVVFSKENMQRKHPRTHKIDKQVFLDAMESVWRINTESAKKIGHPAPFPVELPKRLIEVFSYPDDLVLDPFCGSGTSGIAAIGTNRRFIGYEKHLKYVKLSRNRIRKALNHVEYLPLFSC
jgi:DNA modification methylase